MKGTRSSALLSFSRACIWLVLSVIAISKVFSQATPTQSGPGSPAGISLDRSKDVIIGEQDFVQRAISENAELMKAATDLEARAAVWNLGIRAYLPSITLEYGGNERVAADYPDSFSKRIGLSLEQFLWDGGKSGALRAIDAAQLALDRDAFRRSSVEATESARVVFRNYIALGKKLEIAKRASESGRAQAKIAKVELGIGAIREIDQLEIETKSAELELNETRLEQQLLDAEYALRKAISAEKGRTYFFIGEIDTTKRAVELPDDLSRLIALAVERSPDCSKVRLDFEKTRVQVQASRTSWFPKISLTGSASVNGDRFPLDKTQYTVGITVSFEEPGMPGETSLSLGGGEGEKTANYSASAKPGADFTPYAGRRAEELALAQARKLISSTEADVARSFESLVANYRMSSKSRDVAERRRDAALKKRNVSAKLLETGNITRVDYLKSEEDLYKAEIEFMDSVIALIAAERAIERALDIAPESLPGFIAKIEESK